MLCAFGECLADCRGHVDGTSIYLTRDIGGAIERYERYKLDKIVYVVVAHQDSHLQRFLFKVLQLMGYDWANNLQHVNYGLVLGTSTHKGMIVLLADSMARSAYPARPV